MAHGPARPPPQSRLVMVARAPSSPALIWNRDRPWRPGLYLSHADVKTGQRNEEFHVRRVNMACWCLPTMVGGGWWFVGGGVLFPSWKNLRTE